MKLSHDDTLDAFDSFLDETYPEVDVVTYTWPASYAFKRLDPVAYREEYLNWVDSMVSDGTWFMDNEGHIWDTPPEREVNDRDMEDNKTL